MFVRIKKIGSYSYLQIVENQRVEGKVQQRVLCNLGQLEILRSTGQLDALLRSGLRYSEYLQVLDAAKPGEDLATRTIRIGPGLLFAKLWEELGIGPVILSLLEGRRYQFAMERAIFLTVLHRLFAPGSDRYADFWQRDQLIPGGETLQLHHLYRAMAWLGEMLPWKKQVDINPFGFRAVKDEIEEELFSRTRSLFTDLQLVFFDTTSLYFEGSHFTLLKHYGHSKDHRPDLRQLVVGMVLDGAGNPICSEILPGNTTDVKTLAPVAERLQKRFGIGQVCIVADRGMISAENMREIEQLHWQYILGVRMRVCEEVSEEVLADAHRYHVIHPPRKNSKDPSPLKVKEVQLRGTRYIVCHNEEEAEKDRHDREAIVAALREALKKGDTSLVGNKGYRRYLKTASRDHFDVDENKIKQEPKYDGTWVLTTNTGLPMAEVALKYKQLWMVEDIFRTMKSTLETRPIFHKVDENITGHVFCSFLALKLRKYLQDKLAERGWKCEWRDVIHDVNELGEVEVQNNGKNFIIRTETKGVAGKVFQAAGVALPPVLRGKTIGTTPVPSP